MKIDKILLCGFFESIYEAVRSEIDTLTELDQALGDGDLGLTMTNGFKTVTEFLKSGGDDVPCSELLTQAGFAMAEKVPSTMGTLVSIGIVRAGNALKDRTEWDTAAGLAMLEAAAAGIAARGKAKRGEKTILDALYPAIDAYRAASESGADIAASFRAAADGALAGAEATKALKSTYGKAAVFGESSLGKRDPGAAACAIILAGAAAWFTK